MITYDNFWKTLKQKNVSQYELTCHYKISSSLLARMRKGAPISTHSLNRLCDILDCDVDDILSFQKTSNCDDTTSQE